jgi:uncharacterized membrane protein
MRSLGLFILVILLAVAFAGAGVYYLIPDVPGGHILIFSINGNPNTYHLKHALVCFGLSVLTLLAVRYVQPLPQEKIKTKELVESTSKQGSINQNQAIDHDREST